LQLILISGAGEYNIFLSKGKELMTSDVPVSASWRDVNQVTSHAEPIARINVDATNSYRHTHLQSERLAGFEDHVDMLVDTEA
jgi:hypothetical protein